MRAAVGSGGRRAVARTWMCPAVFTRNGKKRRCLKYRGEHTFHFGYGRCKKHSDVEEEKVWAAVYDVAKMQDVTPWDALIDSVKLAAGRVAWVDQELDRRVRVLDGAEDSSEVRRWLEESRRERTLLARMAKAAIDAGVTERMVRQVELEGALVAEALIAGLDALDLTADQRMMALTHAQRKLLGDGAGQSRTVTDIIDGTIEDDGRGKNL